MFYDCSTIREAAFSALVRTQSNNHKEEASKNRYFVLNVELAVLLQRASLAQD